MNFCRQLGYFDISLGRGGHGSMKYERVPRDSRNSAFLTSISYYNYNFFAHAEARLFISAKIQFILRGIF